MTEKMTEKEYRSHPAISRSELWRMSESPEKFKYYKDNPITPTHDLLFGQLVHKIVLEPIDWQTEFVIAPDVDRRTKDGKAAYNDFLDSVGDRAVITQADYEKAVSMAQIIYKNPMTARLLNGPHEIPLFWTDPDTGEDCKCRLDCLLIAKDGAHTIIDYKSARSARTDVFNRDVYRFGYFFQAAMYSEGAMRALELPERPDFIFIVQEKTAPYSINVISVPSEVMLYGVDTYREFMGTYHECKQLDVWPGYNGMFDEINETYLPGWLTLGVEEGEEE